MTEHQIQTQLFRWWELWSPPELKWNLFAIPNGGKRSWLTGARLKAEGVRRGVPDIMLAAAAMDYHGLFIELKTEKGRLTDNQEAMLIRLDRAGYRAVCCRGYQAAVAELMNYVTAWEAWQ